MTGGFFGFGCSSRFRFFDVDFDDDVSFSVEFDDVGVVFVDEETPGKSRTMRIGACPSNMTRLVAVQLLGVCWGEYQYLNWLIRGKLN